MNYISMKVKEAMKQISGNEIFLPAIQRKFVWGPERIEKLFDSIMRGYPIGTFLFWFVEGETRHEYTFYRFLQDYHERDNALNAVAPRPHLGEKFIGVLDGQQRLNSMYVALQGSYASRRKHGRWNDDKAFPQRRLYINLFHAPIEEEETGVEYQFSFLTAQQASIVDDSQYWFPVRDVLAWESTAPIFGVISEARKAHPELATLFEQRAAGIVALLYQRLCTDDVINYFKVTEQELDRIVEIFIRVNSAGLQLSRTDLLFSSIVAHWDEGRARIEALITSLNDKGNGFAFDNDFIIRSCLVLTDLPILFKVGSFKKENIARIQNHWDEIQLALETTVDLLVEWGFSRETVPALNAVIPIAYFAFKGGDIGASRSALRQYLVRALLNQIFRSKTDKVLGAIRDSLRAPTTNGGPAELRTKVLTLDDVLRMRLPDERTLAVSADDIEEYLSARKGAYTFIVLSLLYPHLKFEQIQFHQDHLHPYALFSTARLDGLGIAPDVIEQWQYDRDRLPNLQLLEGAENKSKNDTPLDRWVSGLDSGGDYFLQNNYIPAGVSLALADFPEFCEARKALLRQKLHEILRS